MISQQSSLARIAGHNDFRIKSPIEKWREVLCHLSSAVVDLQEVTDLIAGSIVASAVPQVTAKDQHIARLAQYGL